MGYRRSFFNLVFKIWWDIFFWLTSNVIWTNPKTFMKNIKKWEFCGLFLLCRFVGWYFGIFPYMHNLERVSLVWVTCLTPVFHRICWINKDNNCPSICWVKQATQTRDILCESDTYIENDEISACEPAKYTKGRRIHNFQYFWKTSSDLF